MAYTYEFDPWTDIQSSVPGEIIDALISEGLQPRVTLVQGIVWRNSFRYVDGKAIKTLIEEKTAGRNDLKLFSVLNPKP